MSISFNSVANAYSNAAKITDDAVHSSPKDYSISDSGFGSLISDSIGNSVSSLKSAENIVQKSLVNQADIADVVNAVTKAEMTLRSVVEIRDKLIAAHQEILRMPI